MSAFRRSQAPSGAYSTEEPVAAAWAALESAAADVKYSGF